MKSCIALLLILVLDLSGAALGTTLCYQLVSAESSGTKSEQIKERYGELLEAARGQFSLEDLERMVERGDPFVFPPARDSLGLSILGGMEALHRHITHEFTDAAEVRARILEVLRQFVQKETIAKRAEAKRREDQKRNPLSTPIRLINVIGVPKEIFVSGGLDFVITEGSGFYRKYRLSDGKLLGERLFPIFGAPDYDRGSSKILATSPDATSFIELMYHEGRGDDHPVYLRSTEDLSSTESLFTFPTHGSWTDGGGLWGAAYSADGKQAAILSVEKAEIWDLDAKTPIGKLNGISERKHALFSANMDFYIVSDQFGVWNHGSKITPSSTPFSPAGLRTHLEPATQVTLSHEGHLVAPDDWHATLRVIDSDNGRILGEYQGHRSKITAVAHSPDGQWMASGDESGVFRIWNASPYSTPSILAVRHVGEISAIRFDASSKYLITASHDGTVALWDLEPVLE